MSSFLRKYKLTIGKTNEGTTRSVSQSAVITDNHIEFDIQKTSDSKNNTAEFKIYNLKRDTIALFDEKDVLISFEAGWQSTPLKLYFRGNKANMITRKEGSDIITVIQCGDGYVSTREGRVTKAFPEKSTLKQVLQDTIKTGMSEIKTVNFTPEAEEIVSKQYNNGYSVTGNAKRNIDSICNAHKLEWHIVDNDVINIMPKKGALPNKAILLTPSNGLIESPEKTSQEIKDLKDELGVAQASGCKFKSFLNADIVPGCLVQIEDTYYTKGTYKVEKIWHRGSYEGDDWTTTGEGVKL